MFLVVFWRACCVCMSCVFDREECRIVNASFVGSVGGGTQRTRMVRSRKEVWDWSVVRFVWTRRSTTLRCVLLALPGDCGMLHTRTLTGYHISARANEHPTPCDHLQILRPPPPTSPIIQPLFPQKTPHSTSCLTPNLQALRQSGDTSTSAHVPPATNLGRLARRRRQIQPRILRHHPL